MDGEMNLDISHILSQWPYKPGEVTARRIVGADGQEKIQLRLDLGMLQMEASGRPDGQRPNGHESLLAYHEYLLQKHTEESDGEDDFFLDEADCEMLRAEGVMYYHRYVAEFVLGDYERVDRDTMRNLRLMDFCRKYARDDSDKFILEQYRPYVIMMRTRARAQHALDNSRLKAALAAARKGIVDIEAFYDAFGSDKVMAHSGELAVLKALEKDIESKIPVDPIQKLRDQLTRAIEAEQYEHAAELRDRLQSMIGQE
jgi:hypothetical protein